MTELVWHRGVPRYEGWWWLLPDASLVERGWLAGPRVYQVHIQGDDVLGGQGLYIRNADRYHSEMKASDFRGQVAGPLMQPITEEEAERLDRQRSLRGDDRPGDVGFLPLAIND